VVVVWSSPGLREDDGRKLDHKTLEQLRIRAVRQIERGAHPEQVAQALGMTRAAVYSWLAKYRQGGLEALRASRSPAARRSWPANNSPEWTGWWWATTPGSCGLRLRCGPARWSAS
jgi:hypothetical protein